MDKMEILERLVSLKSNALGRASNESQEDIGRKFKIKAFILEQGIEQLIMEIQNGILVESKTSQNTLVYKMVSSQAS